MRIDGDVGDLFEARQWRNAALSRDTAATAAAGYCLRTRFFLTFGSFGSSVSSSQVTDT